MWFEYNICCQYTPFDTYWWFLRFQFIHIYYRIDNVKSFEAERNRNEITNNGVKKKMRKKANQQPFIVND